MFLCFIYLSQGKVLTLLKWFPHAKMTSYKIPFMAAVPVMAAMPDMALSPSA